MIAHRSQFSACHSLTDFGHMVYKLEYLISLILLEFKVYCYVFQTVCHDPLEGYEISLVD